MSLTIQTQIHIQAPVEIVWKMLMDFKNHSKWNPFIKEISGKQKIGEVIAVELGGMKFQPVIKELKENEEFKWKGKLLIKGLFDGEHQFVLEKSAKDETLFHQNEKFDGLLVGLFKKKLLSETKQSFIEMNEALKSESEKALIIEPYHD